MFTNKCKAFALVLFLFVYSTNVWSDNSQFSFGPVLRLGTGRTNTHHLGEVMERRSALDIDIKEHSKYALPGIFFAAGGQFTWHISDRFEAGVSVNYSRLANTILLKQTEDDSHVGLTEREIIESEALITKSSIQLPFSIDYNLPTSSAWFLRAGTVIDIVLSAGIESEEKITEKEWENGRLVATSEYKKHMAEIDNVTPSQFSLLLGGGHRFMLGRKNLDIALEMIVPLTKAEFYTTDRVFTDNTELNELYSLEGSIDAAQDTGIRLDDFGFGSIRLTASYLFGLGDRK